MESEIEKSERLKTRKKAIPGGRPKFINLLKNWLHQGFTYMDRGEQIFKLLTELVEFYAVYILIPDIVLSSINSVLVIICVFIIVHTFNWVTNNLFWSIVMFTFPGMRNPGALNTYKYLSDMSERLKTNQCIKGMALYGSMSRRQWHERSDIDIRLLRAKGFVNLILSGLVMMRERFIAFIYKQPTDIFLADDVDFLLKMRSDEKPLFLIKRDIRLDETYPNNSERTLTMEDFCSYDSPLNTKT